MKVGMTNVLSLIKRNNGIVEPKLFNSIVEIFDYMDIKGGKISNTKKAIKPYIVTGKQIGRAHV